MLVLRATANARNRDLGGELGAAAAAGVAVATWAVTVVIADVMGRRGQRGPAEALLRHLAYRPRTRDRELTRARTDQG